MIFAAAQFEPSDNVSENIMLHERYAEKAAELNAGIIIFPEMSLTGYQKEKAAELSFVSSDERLNVLREISIIENIIIAAGAPLNISNSLYIGIIIFMPDGSERIYTKQYLHTGEDEYFENSFKYNQVIEIEKRISFAVCADIEEKKHLLKASLAVTDIYCAEIFYTGSAIDHAHEILSSYAKEYEMCVMMSNFCGTSYKLHAGGRSAFWNRKGELIAQMNSSNSGLLIIEERSGNYSGNICLMNNE